MLDVDLGLDPGVEIDDILSAPITPDVGTRAHNMPHRNLTHYRRPPIAGAPTARADITAKADATAYHLSHGFLDIN